MTIESDGPDNPSTPPDQAGPAETTPADGDAALRRRAEELIRDPAAATPAESSPDDAGRLLHELRVHQAELELQNEELRRAQESLERVRQRYFELYDRAPVGYVTLSEQGLIHEVNHTAAQLLGTSRGALVRQPLSRFVLPEDHDAFYLHRRRLLAGHGPPACEVRLRRGSDGSFWARLESTATPTPDSGSMTFWTVISDIDAVKTAEVQLTASERRLRRAQAIARIGGWEWDVASGRVSWSDEVYRLHGLAPGAAEPSHELARSLVHPADLALWEQTTAAWLEPGEPTALEYRVKRSDGSTAWVRNEVEVFRDGAHNAVRVAGTVQDITERRAAEQAVLQAERRFRVTIENVHLIGVELDAEGRVTFVNDHALQLLGWQREELLGRDWFETVLPAPHAAEVRAAFDATLRSGAIVPHFDNSIQTRTNEQRLVHWSNTTLHGPDGSVTGTFSLGEDRTEVAAAEAALRASEARYRTLFETMRQGVFHQAADGTLLDVNPAALEMFGLTYDELLGRTSHHPEWDVVREDGTPLPAAEHPSMVALRTGQPVRNVVLGVRNARSGARLWLSVNAQPEFQPGEHTPFRVAVTLHDLTERKRAESQLGEQLTELRRWHAVTLDREQRILELKREVNEALALAGRPPRFEVAAEAEPGPERAPCPPGVETA